MTAQAQLLQAVDALNDHLLEAQSWLDAFNLPEQPAPGVFAASQLLGRICTSAEALETLIRRREGSA